MKRKMLFHFGVVVVMLQCTTTIYAQQDNNSNFSFGADLVSRYVWRGLNLGGSTPHIQPNMEYAFGNSGLSAGVWASYPVGLSDAGSEIDLYISYSPTNWLNLTVYDYYFPIDNPFERNGFFNYKEDETEHTLEANLTLGGSDKLPVYLLLAMNFYGVDGVNQQGENYNAKYAELGFNGSTGEYSWSLFAGYAPDDPKTDLGGIGFYADKPGVVNLGFKLSKDFEIAKRTFPVFSSVIANPEAENLYLVVGITF